MLMLFILNGFFSIGNVDLIEESVALVEYKTDDGFVHKNVRINKNICIPKEGQRVAFNDKEIISCL